MTTKFEHPFNDDRCRRRLLWEYKNHPQIFVGIDFDNTVKTVHPDKSCKVLLDLLRQCSADKKIVLCLWTISADETELNEKITYMKSENINIDYINESPFNVGKNCDKKQYFNVLLDDRAGLESAYNNLKYVIDNANN